MEPIRSFVAIELPEQVKSVLKQLQNDLKRSKAASVKWAGAEGIHLTLKFLGNVDASEIPKLKEALLGATRKIAPFRLELGNPGAFPNTHAPRVVWVGVGGEVETLHTLHNNVERELVPLGFSPDERSFSPHLTLGRVREGSTADERRCLGEVVASLKVGEKPTFEVGALSLMRSTLTPNGAVYSCLTLFALAGR